MSSCQSILSNVFSLDALYSVQYDGKILMLCKGLRMFGFGFLAVILGIYNNMISNHIKS